MSSDNQAKRVVWIWIIELGLAWPAAASTTPHRPGSGWAEEEGWQEGQEQLGKGRV